MRPDTAGFFWDDTPVPKVLKEKVVRKPVERIWENPDYLPYIDEAREFNLPLLTDDDLLHGTEKLVVDVEVYPNYFECGVRGVESGKVLYFETDEEDYVDGIGKLDWLLKNRYTVGFNSLRYDLCILALVLEGCTCQDLQFATEEIILRNESPRDILKRFRVKPIKVNHVDLIEVAPLRASLKTYAGRLHAQRMQDLPIPAGTVLTPDQKLVVRWYNVASDLPATALMYHELEDQIRLREAMSMEYHVDLRSRSDAQIAEAVIGHEISRLNGIRPQWPEIRPGSFRYQPPAFLQYQSELMRWAFQQVCSADFEIGADGTVGLPVEVGELKLEIGGSKYQMGIGGLHSNEQKVYYFSSDSHTIYDRDVTSYYPSLILNSRMFPQQLGRNFLEVYRRIVNRRVEAKARKDKVTADTLKITANGTFGKLGSPYSILYAPNLLIQVTLTGQLSLLMLIERMEMAGIPVVSANTDGIVMHCPNELRSMYQTIIKQWEIDTGLVTEETIYSAYYSRDVNNYIAVKPDGKIKAKGAYSDPWSDPELAIFRFHKNPVNLICTEAVQKFLAQGIPVEQTVYGCKDPARFITIRSVRGGAAKDGEYLGKAVRWYYAKEETGEILAVPNGHLVPRSQGARPLLNLPSELPEDLDHGWYVQEARSMLAALGLPEGIG